MVTTAFVPGDIKPTARVRRLCFSNDHSTHSETILGEDTLGTTASHDLQVTLRTAASDCRCPQSGWGGVPLLFMTGRSGRPRVLAQTGVTNQNVCA
jgi:hypothetical protein